MDLNLMQQEHQEWASKNFPNRDLIDPVLGMMEELGELSFAVLKNKQGIRGVGEEEIIELVKDAHADLIIFSLGLAELYGYSLEEVLQQTWDGVKQRNWVEDPQKGGQS